MEAHGARAQPAVERDVDRRFPVRRLVLHLRECVAVDHLQHALDAERADQLALEIGAAHVHVVENTAEEVRLVLVAEASHARAGRKSGDEAADRLRAADRNDLDAFGPEIASRATRKEFQDDAIARPFHRYE